jgi:hypothetical protein
MMMPYPQASVYVLCFLTSVICAGLLVRSYLANRSRLLLFSATSFVLLALNNLLVVTDILVFPAFNLMPLRHLAALAAAGVLLFGFIWEIE